MESINLCRDVLVTTARDRYQQWNNIVDTIKYILRDIFEEVNETYPKDVSKNVEWVLLNYLVEKEYEDLYPNGYYQKWIKWYFAGHHICGWQGEFPDGKLIIYLVTCRPFSYSNSAVSSGCELGECRSVRQFADPTTRGSYRLVAIRRSTHGLDYGVYFH